MLHIVYYIFNNESLPWIENLSGAIPDISTFVINSRFRKYTEYSNKIKANLPSPLRIAYSYIRSLSFDEKPDYDYLSELFNVAGSDETNTGKGEVYDLNNLSFSFDSNELTNKQSAKDNFNKLLNAHKPSRNSAMNKITKEL
ncbi:MAG: hypothetical protein ACMG6E_07575 [Candidatus Roizmanbacteria bacterium]